VVEDGDTLIEAPLPIEVVCAELVYQTHEAPVPSEPPVTESVVAVPAQTGAVAERLIPVGGEDAAPGAEQAQSGPGTVRRAWVDDAWTPQASVIVHHTYWLSWGATFMVSVVCPVWYRSVLAGAKGWPPGNCTYHCTDDTVVPAAGVAVKVTQSVLLQGAVYDWGFWANWGGGAPAHVAPL
jgi:hypothetical protein